MEAAELPANALPPGWSAAGGAGAKDPEAAQRQAQQVRELSEGSVQLSAFSFLCSNDSRNWVGEVLSSYHTNSC